MGFVENQAAQRHEMIEQQLKERGIKDARVLKAIGIVPREDFTPAEVRSLAYEDTALPIGFGQTISQPYIVAFMTEAAKLKPSDKVLEIGTGSGYQAAVLSHLANKVYTIEIVKELAEQAEKCLRSYKNIQIKQGDGSQGWQEEAPFDVILLTAAPNHLPQPLIEQLKIGGILIVPLTIREGYQVLTRYKKTDKGLEEEQLLPVRFVPLTGEIFKK